MDNVLLENGEISRNLFHYMNEAFVIGELILDTSGKPDDYRHLEVNQAFEKIIGKPAVQIQGKTQSQLGYKDPNWLEIFGQAVTTGAPASRVDYSSGYGKWFDLRAFPLGGQRFACLLMDITERQQEKNFGQALNEINEIIYSKLEFYEIMNKIIIAAVKNIGCETAAISLGRTGDWTMARCYGFPEEMILGPMNRVVAEGQEPITEMILKTKQPLMIQDVFADRRMNREQAKKWNIRSVMGIPLLIEDQVLGVIFFNYHQHRFHFSPPYIHFARKLAATISLAIKNAQLFYRVRMELTARKQLEEELKKANEDLEERVRERTEEVMNERQRLYSVLETLPAYVILLDKDYQVPFANKIFRERFGESQGKRCYEYLFHKTTPCDNCETFKVFQTNAPHRWEWTGPDMRNYDIYDYPFRESGGSLMILEMGIDITERKRAEIAVQAERQRLFDVLETLPVMICLLRPDHHVAFVNRSFREKFGEAGGRYCYEYCFGNTQPCKFCQTYMVLETGKSQHWELTCPDETVLEIHNFPFIDVDGSLLILEMKMDITERIKYEKALAKERELLMVTLDSLTEGVIAIDSEGRIFLINEAAVNLTGYSKLEAIDELLNKILDLIDDKTNEPMEITVQSLLVGRRSPFNQVLITRDLRKIPISLNCSLIKSSSNNAGPSIHGMDNTNIEGDNRRAGNSSVGEDIIGTVIVFADITEKQKTEQELCKADKLESLGILAGGIAHDFNNLLAAILSNIQLAQIKYKKNEDIAKYLQESVDSTRRASELTRQLLTFAKGGAPIKKAASLAELIRDTALFALRGASVKVECQISENLWPVEADSGQISQVIHNLVINANQAMPHGGWIYINAENIIIGPKQRFRPGNYIKIAVLDQGVGIPKENLSKIFDPFFTTKKEGSGLGLATSYSIIRQHDGYLEVESETGVGTTFFIYLPALTEKLLLTETQKEVSVTREGLRILLMDDEAIILNSVSEMLEHFGHQVTPVTDGAGAVEAYERALQTGASFDIVIMDLTVPGGMGGKEAIAHLLKIDPNVKAIVSSGYANDPIIADHHKFGFSGGVTKPYKFDELNEVLQRVGAG